MSPSTPALRPQLQQQLLVLDAISFPSPPPQPLPKNFHGYAAIKNYFVGLNIFFTGLNWHYHIHPILNGQQNKTTNKIELQHIIDLYHESNIATCIVLYL